MKLFDRYIGNTQQRNIEYKRIKSYLNAHPKILIYIGLVSMFLAAYINGKIVQGGRHLTHGIPLSHNPFIVLYYGVLFDGSFGAWAFLSALIFLGIVMVGRHFILEKEVLNEDGNFVQSLTGEYGTAHYMRDDIQKYLFKKSKNVAELKEDILGVDRNTDEVFTINPDAPYEYRVCPHKLVGASSGRGKTRTIIINDILQTIERGESIVCTDPKGELYMETFLYAKEHGYLVKVLNLEDLVNSDAINFMYIIKYDSSKALTMAQNIVEQSAEISAGGDIFVNGAKALIACAILAIALDPKRPDKEKNLYEVYNFINGRSVEEIEQALKTLSPLNPAHEQWKSFRGASVNLQGSIMANVGSLLNIFALPAVRAITSHDDIDIIAPSKQKCAYYVVMQSSDRTYDTITAQFFSLMLKELEIEAKNHISRQVNIPVHIILEEFANCGRIPSVTHALAAYRSMGIRLTIVIQGIEQLKRLYPSQWQDFLTNTDIKVILGVNEIENAKLWAELTGDTTTQVTNSSESEEGDETKRMTGKGRRTLLTPHEILTLSRKLEILFIGGFDVLLAKKFDYSNHPAYPKLKKELAVQHEPSWWADETVQSQPWFKMAMFTHQERLKNIKEEMKELEEKQAREWAEEQVAQAIADKELEAELQNNPALRAKMAVKSLKDNLVTEDGKFDRAALKTSTKSAVHALAKKIAESTAVGEDIETPPESTTKVEAERTPEQTPAIVQETLSDQTLMPKAESMNDMIRKMWEAEMEEATAEEADSDAPEDEDEDEGVTYTPSSYDDDDGFITVGNPTTVTKSDRELANERMKQLMEDNMNDLRAKWNTSSSANGRNKKM